MQSADCASYLQGSISVLTVQDTIQEALSTKLDIRDRLNWVAVVKLENNWDITV